MIRTETRREELLVNMTPMIDVMIFLIVFFLAATNFAEIEREQDVRLPELRTGTGSLSQTLDRKVVINIKKDGTIFVEGRKLSENELKALVVQRHSTFKDAFKVEFRADKRAPWDYIAPVLALVREAGVLTPAFDLKQATLEP